MKTKSKNLLWLLLLALCALVLAFSAYNIITQLTRYQVAKNEYGTVAALAYEKPTASLPGHETQTINFEALIKMNPEIVGWLQIPGTPVDYPIVQGKNNDDYLNKTFQGTPNKSGAIFMDFRNQADFSGNNTLVYGHRMNDGSMFSALSNYRQQAFWQQYPTFTLFTPQGEYLCEVVSAYETLADSDAYSIDSSPENFSNFLQFILSQSVINTGVTPTVQDKIITLSTCTNQSDDTRMVVHARIKKK